jgi:hypothetical protein
MDVAHVKFHDRQGGGEGLGGATSHRKRITGYQYTHGDIRGQQKKGQGLQQKKFKETHLRPVVRSGLLVHPAPPPTRTTLSRQTIKVSPTS